MADPYQTLGVKRDASQDEIRKSYRKIAKESHPDLNPGKPEAEARFKQANAAYDIIGDADKRKRYDAGEIDETGAERQPERHFYREYADNPNTRYSRRASAGRGNGGESEFDYDIFSDLFRNAGAGDGGFGGGSGGRGAGARGGSNFRMPPQDARYALEISFLDAVNGAQKTVIMPDGKTLDIKIPAGIETGKVLRLKGQGLPGSDGKTGDAYVEIEVAPHPNFVRQGDDILSTLPVSLGEALNGASVRAETPSGPVDVKVPRLTKDGSKLRLRGKGVAHKKGDGHGDQLIEIRIMPPEGADDALARFMAEWEKTHPQNPRKKGAV